MFQYGNEFFNNAGLFRKSQGLGATAIQINFTNTGTVSALVGTINFNVNFITAGGTFAFGVSGLGSFGQIHFAKDIAIDGTASVAWLGGFIPAVGNSFGVINYPSHSGTFANLNFPSGTQGQGIYADTLFSLLVTAVTGGSNPPILTIAPVTLSTTAVSWPTSVGNYILQTSPDLLPGSWNNIGSGITIVGTNNVFTTPLNGKKAFFRLKSQ